MNKSYLTPKEEQANILEEVAREFQVDTELLQQLINYEHGRVHLRKRRNAKDELRRLIEQWIEEQ